MHIYKFIGRNVEITDAMRSYAEDKLTKLERFSEHIVDARVVMSYAGNANSAAPAKVEVQINVPNGIVRAEESGADTYSATDLVVDKLERQLKRYKERDLAKRNESVPEPETEEETYDTPEIVRVKKHALRPMTPEDAAMQMEDLGHTFFVFRDATTENINVIYIRHDGDYGLIEPS
ncbi:MAG: ribosome-associated translation inhibitor RaiA [Deinococcota bacterium]